MVQAPQRPYSVVLGLGSTGLSLLRHLHGREQRLLAMDSRAAPPELERVRQEFPDLPLLTGGFDADLLEQAALIAVSPGIAADEPALLRARERGVDVAGDVELFARIAEGPIAAITGTNGKSTVTTLLGAILLGTGREVAVGGNLGPPVLDLLEGWPADGYVLELSSFQLDLTASLRPACAAILNVSEDHLDRYGSLQAYAASKQRIYRGAEIAVFSADDPLTHPGPEFRGRRVPVHGGPAATADGWGIEPGADGRRWLMGKGRPLLPVTDLPLAGRHNERNVLFALAMADALGVDPEAAFDTVRKFEALPHRCTPVATLRGVRFIDDSKATNVGACMAAIEGLADDASDAGAREGEAQRRLVVIAGGLGKGADFQRLREPFARWVKAAVLIGTDAPALARVLNGVCELRQAGDMEAAVAEAQALAVAGDTVLLAPACASFDMFDSYVDRGQRFVAAIERLAGEGS